MDEKKDVEAPKPRRFEALSSYFALLVYASPTWKDYLLLFVGTIAAAAGGVPFPLMGILFGQLVDDLNAESCDATPVADPAALQSEINHKILLLVYAAIASFVAIYVYLVVWSIFSRRLEARLRDRYFSALLHQDSRFFDQRSAGELATRLNADIQAIQSGTSEKVGICIACVAFFLTAYIIAFIKNTKLAAMLIALIPAFMGMASAGSYFTQKFTTRMSDAIASASSIAQETLSHIAVVQAFGMGKRLEGKFDSLMQVAKREGIKKAATTALQAGLLYFIAYAANALAFWQGSLQIAHSRSSDGNVSVGQIYTVIFLLVDACVVLGYVAPLLPLLGAAAASFRKVRADIEAPCPIDSSSPDGTKLPSSAPASLSFQNVSFAYYSRPDNPVLKSVSLDCPAGKYTALVGLSGSGKSTIAGLASRLYDPTEGTVYFSDHDIKTLNVRNLRGFMSLVQQEPSLLDRSVLENIVLGLANSPWEHHQKFQPLILSSAVADTAKKLREGEKLATVTSDPDMLELIELVRKSVNLADALFIENLESGYGTSVGVGGKLVSGGQRQRIALARALIRDPKVLILDEATASLDSASEKRIQLAVESIAKDRTVVAIAHRLSTIKNADNIIVMNAGEVIEQGTHSQLMDRNGSYAAMVRLQTVNTEQQPASARTSVTEVDSIMEQKATASEAGEVAPEEKAPPLPTGTIMRRLFAFIRPKVFYLILAIIASIMVGATFSSAGVIFGNTVSALSPCHSVSAIKNSGLFFSGMFFLLACIELFANSASWSSFGYLAETMLYRIRVLTFRALYSQPLDWHQAAGRSPSSLLSIITSDTAAVGGFSGSIIGTVFSIVVNLLIAVILCHIIAWKIAIVCLVTVPILLGTGVMQARSLSQFERKHADAFSNATSITTEAVNSYKTVSSLSIEAEVLNTHRRALHAPQKETGLFSAYANFWLAIANSIGNMIYAFAYWWGSTRIAAGEYTQTQFLIVLVAMLISAQLWGQMFSLAPEVSRARAAAGRILNIIDLPSEDSAKDIEASAEAEPKIKSSDSGATVVFRDVTFAYPARPSLKILQGMSFTIQSGQFVGLVGPSGAGKSTIMSLAQRMYRPTAGAVEVNGVNIGTRTSDDFRDDIAVVPQDCALFNGTIRFNVALGARPDETVTDEQIHEACRIANIHETIMALPDGYDTECGPNGSRLSGGQRQRLAIARALVRKPKLLLLDESTSALDAESERALQDGLERASQNITVIAITHRLHTVRKADVIFVVEGGKVVDKGRHEDLVERSESYRVNALQQMLA